MGEEEGGGFFFVPRPRRGPALLCASGRETTPSISTTAAAAIHSTISFEPSPQPPFSSRVLPFFLRVLSPFSPPFGLFLFSSWRFLLSDFTSVCFLFSSDFSPGFVLFFPHHFSPLPTPIRSSSSSSSSTFLSFYPSSPLPSERAREKEINGSPPPPSLMNNTNQPPTNF